MKKRNKPRQGKIIQTCISYLIENSKKFPNPMSDENYFLIKDRLDWISHQGDHYYDPESIAKGTAIDVLADTIEKGKFYSGYKGGHGDAQMILLRDGETIWGHKIKILNESVFIPAKKVKPKKYLDILRTPEGFKQTVELLAIEGDLEEIASRIYNSK